VCRTCACTCAMRVRVCTCASNALPVPHAAFATAASSAVEAAIMIVFFTCTGGRGLGRGCKRPLCRFFTSMPCSPRMMADMFYLF
jgi:hypothetical protein